MGSTLKFMTYNLSTPLVIVSSILEVIQIAFIE